MHALTLILLLSCPVGAVPDLSWSGQGGLRVLVRVPTAGDGTVRDGDERPAEVALDFVKLLDAVAPGRLPDLNTVQVIRHNAKTGRPMRQGKFAHGRGPFDVPFRWYDASIGYAFPEFAGYMDATDGKLSYAPVPRLGYFYDCIGDWRCGRLAFVHRDAIREAWYAVYFDLLAAEASPETVPPRGWIGDGLNRCEPKGRSTTGLIHSRLDVVDWDGDGLFDLIVGCARGGVVWYPNRGRPGEPRFSFSRLVKTADGRPLDVGWSAAPHAVDWDDDGLTDLVVGAEWNRVVLYRNTGTRTSPVLSYEGLIRTQDGQPLHVPWAPSPETEKHFKYTRDYYPVLTTADWDADGDLDLLAGGYVTGRVYLFENVGGRTAGQSPRLRFAGPIETDGEPIDVGWAAAPTVADLDGDGDLDVISGCMPMTKGGGDSTSSKRFLHYFRNDGTRAEPRLHNVPLPCTGTFPRGALGTPRLIDFSNDGVLDLVVSAGTQIYLYRNVGAKEAPRFEAHARRLPSRWGNAPLAANQFLDWDGDGLLDAVAAPRVRRNTGRGSPGIFDRPFSLLAAGRAISHRSGIGDDWVYQRLYDLDGDGRIDLMDADHAGHFWWHRNRAASQRAEPDFETKGVRLTLTDGGPMSVGAGMTGFNALQGARATYCVADFDGDGRADVVAANALGRVHYFRQAPPTGAGEPTSRPGSGPRFLAALQIGKLPTRAAPCAADWNGDGRLDVVVAANAASAFVFCGRDRSGGSGSPFAPAERIVLPQAPYGAGPPVVVADFNADGDPDILLWTAYGYCCYYEHSFVRSGYAKGVAVGLERRDTARGGSIRSPHPD